MPTPTRHGAGILWVFALLIWPALPSCDGGGRNAPKPQQGETPAPDKESYELAVIPKGTSHEFWKSIHAGARKAEAAINAQGDVEVRIIWKGPLKEDDRKHQIDLVQTFISRGVDGIVLAPLDKDALVRPVRDAMSAGIPVVVIDSGLRGEAGKDFVSYIATNNYHGGELAARRLGQVLGGKGDVILLRYQVGSESTEQREKGFLDVLAREFPDIEVISKDQYGGATTELSMKKAQNLLTRFGRDVEGIFAPNESTCFGMLRALKDSGLAGKVKFVGFDASEALVQAVRDGEIDGLVLQDPLRMGEEGVLTMMKHLRGEPVEPLVDTGAVVLTKQNMNDPRMKQLHTPDLSRWLGE